MLFTSCTSVLLRFCKVKWTTLFSTQKHNAPTLMPFNNWLYRNFSCQSSLVFIFIFHFCSICEHLSVYIFYRLARNKCECFYLLRHFNHPLPHRVALRRDGFQNNIIIMYHYITLLFNNFIQIIMIDFAMFLEPWFSYYSYVNLIGCKWDEYRLNDSMLSPQVFFLFGVINGIHSKRHTN